jgi:hypothetical protein
MQTPWLWLPLALTVASASALAQHPVQPLPKVGGCPLGYYSSGGYCVPSSSGNTRGAIEKTGSSLPAGMVFTRRLLRQKPLMAVLLAVLCCRSC